MDTSTIINIIFGCITAISVGATIIFGILNHKLSKKSLQIAVESTNIAKNVYLSSIQPHLDVKCEKAGYPSINVQIDAMFERTPEGQKFPDWWGHKAYILIKNNGNGSAIEPKIKLTHPDREIEINPKTRSIAKDDFYLIIIAFNKEKNDVKPGGYLVEKYYEIIYISDHLDPWDIKLIETKCANINGDEIVTKSVDYPFKPPRT